MSREVGKKVKGYEFFDFLVLLFYFLFVLVEDALLLLDLLLRFLELDMLLNNKILFLIDFLL